MAICLPGIASRVNRAATSATRSEPFVITIKLIMTSIKNTTKPTKMFPPTTKDPNVSTTAPASPPDKIALVVETFSASRNNVSTNKREGKIEKSSAVRIFIAASRVSNAKAILIIIKKLRSVGGKGMTSITTIKITPIITDKSFTFIPYSPNMTTFF